MLAVLMLCSTALGMEIPVSQTESLVDGRPTIVKVYDLPENEDPQILIEDDFIQNGYIYTMTSIVKEPMTDKNTMTDGALVVDRDTTRYTLTYTGSDIPEEETPGFFEKLFGGDTNEDDVVDADQMQSADESTESSNELSLGNLCMGIFCSLIAVGAIGFAIFEVVKYVRRPS